MKKLLILVSVVAVSVGTVFAASFDEFKNQLSGPRDIAQRNIDNFAKDIGALIAGGSFHQGKALGIPGFDVGIHVPATSVNKDNAIVKAAGIDSIFLPVVQAEIGLPAKIDLIGRFSAYENSSLIGGGIRYGVFKAGLPGLPSLSLQATYNALNVDAGDNKFTASAMSVGGVLSFDLPFINPYLGAGFDSTTVEPDATVVTGLKGTASGYRLEGGVNLSLLPLTYLQLGGTYLNGEIGYTAGFGVAF